MLLTGNVKFFEGALNGFGIIAVNDPLAVVKDNQRYDVTVKMIIPFTVPAVVLLDVSCLIGDSMCGEKTFRLGAEASAIGNKDHNPLCRGI